MKKIFWNCFFLTVFFLFSKNVQALHCEYNESGYKDDTIRWEVDTAQSKPANHLSNPNLGMRKAGREPVINWDTSIAGGYTAKSDINNNQCPQYLIQTFYDYLGVGYEVFLSNQSSLSSLIGSDRIRYFGVFNWERTVFVYQLANRTKSSEVAVTCNYTYNGDEQYSYQLLYDKEGNLMGYSGVNVNAFTAGFALSYTMYQEKVNANSCNPNTYWCGDFDMGMRRIFMNENGLLNEDKNLSIDDPMCMIYEYSPETSSSPVGTPESSPTCQEYTDIYEDMSDYAAKFKQCSENNEDCSKILQDFHNEETKLNSLCENMYRGAYYSDSCVQKCVSMNSEIAKLKEENNINSLSGDSNSCNISERLAAWLIRIVSWVRYIVPVVIIILTILDFIKAIAADNEDEIKKVSGRFAKRLIVALIIFLLPLLLEFILGIFGQDTYQYCLK